MNLLPPHYKAGLQLEAWRRFLVFFGIYSSVIGIAAVALLLPSYFFLQFQIGGLESLEKVTRSSPDYEAMEHGKKTIKKTQRLLTATDQFLKSDRVVTPLIADIISRIPESVVLSDFAYTHQAGVSSTLKLSGVAKHRDDLTAFAINLQKSPYVKEKIAVPESSYRRISDTPFVLSLVIGPPAL